MDPNASVHLHDVVQKALIAEEELNSGGQGRTPSRQGVQDTRSTTTPDTSQTGFRASRYA
jgi:hypothetical protein